MERNCINIELKKQRTKGRVCPGCSGLDAAHRAGMFRVGLAARYSRMTQPLVLTFLERKCLKERRRRLPHTDPDQLKLKRNDYDYHWLSEKEGEQWQRKRSSLKLLHIVEPKTPKNLRLIHLVFRDWPTDDRRDAR